MASNEPPAWLAWLTSLNFIFSIATFAGTVILLLAVLVMYDAYIDWHDTFKAEKKKVKNYLKENCGGTIMGCFE